MARQRDYKAEYQRRIERGLQRGLSKSQARGHPNIKKGESYVKGPKEKLPTSYHIQGWQSNGKGKSKRWRSFDVPLSKAQAQEVRRLEKLGKPKTARTYVLAAVYGSNPADTSKFPADGGTPILAGIKEYQPGLDYDTGNLFPKSQRPTGYEDYDYDDYDFDDYAEEGESGYGIEE